MRYFIFFIFILLHSCSAFKHQQPVQEKKFATKDTVRAGKEPVAESRMVIDTIPGAQFVFDPSMVVATSSSGYPWIYYTGESSIPLYNFSALFAMPLVSVKIDSVSIPPTAAFADTNPVAAIKEVPKSSATILPGPESSNIPYIVSGIAGVFLLTLFFAFMKRRKKI